MDDEGVTDRVLDEELLRVVARRVGALTLVDTVSVFPVDKPDSIVAQFDARWYPDRVDRVTLEGRAYLDGTFHITYREEWVGRSWMGRWDRHPSPHSSRDHFHRPPEARTEDAADRAYPADLLAVLELVLEAVDDRFGDGWKRGRQSG